MTEDQYEPREVEQSIGYRMGRGCPLRGDVDDSVVPCFRARGSRGPAERWGGGGGKAPPDYGLEWCTVGDPGNRATLPHEVPGVPPPFPTEYGAVAYTYRMTRTEITAGQWLEFVEAYGPFNKGDLNDNAFTGPYIDHIGGGFVLFGDPNRPTMMSFEFAARFANWMHNDKALTAEAFESGAYDTSTFYVDDRGVYHHQAQRSPGAKFWIPSLDEWTKAAHWDPEADRYWYHQGGQDEPLISGPPGVGQTNAGIPGGPDLVGQYPSVMSPWGLLDTSGGVRELTETVPVWMGFENEVRVTRASTRLGGIAIDRLDSFGLTGVEIGLLSGLRLASAVPVPSTAFVLVGVAAPFTRRRRRSCGTHSGWPLYSAPFSPQRS